MWGESSKKCESNCQCSGLITENFQINSGNSASKRRREEAFATNYKLKISPHTIDFTKSPLQSPVQTKRRILGEIQNSPLYRNRDNVNSPMKVSPLTTTSSMKRSPMLDSPLNSSLLNRLTPKSSLQRNISSSKVNSSKITRVFEERKKFKMENKENESSFMSETFMKLDVDEETRDSVFFQSKTTVTNWRRTMLNFSNVLQSQNFSTVSHVPEKLSDIDDDFHTLHDLEAEFENDNFDQCTKYEIISTDSPNIVSRGRSSTSKITASNFEFGAPLSENEASTSFNRPNPGTTRMLNFENSFEFTSPAAKRTLSVKKSLKFNDTPTKNPLKHERSDSSIGSMPSPTKLKIFPSESTTSMESGFISELEEPFLELEDTSNSPQMANLTELLSGQIKTNVIKESEFIMRRPTLNRSLSLNPEASKARVSLFSILETPKEERKSQKRETDNSELMSNKRLKSNWETSELRVQRPVLQRAFSENNASIMSALSRSVIDSDLIGDFSQTFALPLTTGEHSDLKSISGDTLAALLKGDFKDTISDFQVIDCRYPYEYEGGHIIGALNLYTTPQIDSLATTPPKQGSDRSVLVFHCEFSRERGPKLSRFLRSKDREINAKNYPSLYYPEIYILHEGYSAFYKSHPELCAPNGYTAMLDPRHKESLRKHRSFEQPSSSILHRKQRLLR